MIASDPRIDPLLAPISDDAPAGVWLRFEPVYDEIKRLREEEDAGLPQGVWQRELKRADWPAVAELCAQVLEGASKDLQVAAWLTEAWIRVHGFPGLERGARLLAGLCRGFWPDLYPPLEGDDLDARLAPIVWAAERLALPLKRVPVTAPTGEDTPPYGWQDWEDGLHLGNLARMDPAAAAKAEERGMVPQTRFLVSVSLTPAPRLVETSREVAGALAALVDLEAALRDLCGAAAPSLSTLRNVLTAIQSFVSRVLEERGEAGFAPAGSDPEEIDVPAPARPASAAILSRAEAFQRLSEAADYLLRTEPHSPVPYLVRRAITWGNLSLAELLAELLQKNADLSTLYTLLGIKKTS